MKAQTPMRITAFAILLAIAVAMPLGRRDEPLDPLLTDADLAGVILSLAPAAGPVPSGTAPADGSIGHVMAPLGRWLDPKLGIAFVAGAMVMGAVGLIAARRRRDERTPVDRLPETVAQVIAPAPAEPAPPAPVRAELNALSNALATIDLLDVEARTSLRHAGRAVADLVTLVAQGRLVAVEPLHMAGQAEAAARALDHAIAAVAEGARAHAAALTDLRARETRLAETATEAFAAAETMDTTFQDFLAALAAPAGESAEDARARAARLNERIEMLTTAIVAVEERLVRLDEALAQPATSDPQPACIDDGVGDLARAAQRLRDSLEPLVAMLAPADRYVADVRERGAQASQAIDTALDRIGTILAGFAGREDRRRFHRVHADLGAKILVEGTWTDCRIINISLGGAAIDAALDCAAGQQGQISLHGWDGLMPVIVTGVSQGRTHLCFQVTEALERSIKSFIDQLPVAA